MSHARNQTSIAQPLLTFLHWCLNGISKKALGALQPRLFSNNVLRKYLPYFSGDIINVSGWEDGDKEGGAYRNYYGSRNRYVVSNIDGVNGMPDFKPKDVEFLYLDLEKPLEEKLRGKFDVVFSHTVLEHIFETQTALDNIIALSRDVVVTVVPFSQSVHYSRSYSDFVRLSPYFLKRYFENHGFTVLLSTFNDQPFYPVYVVFIASLHPKRYGDAFKDAPLVFDVQIHPGHLGTYGRSGVSSNDD